MSMLGTHVTLAIGDTVPMPIPASLLGVLDSVEVVESSEGFSGFRIAFFMTRAGPAAALGASVPDQTLLKPFNRVVIGVLVGAVPTMLIDGFITQVQVVTGTGGVNNVLYVTGEDSSVMMGLTELTQTYKAQADWMIVNRIILRYARYGVMPMVTAPRSSDQPSPTGRIPTQHESDRAYVTRLAQRYGYEFYVAPSEIIPFQSVAYWGPPRRLGLDQPALTIGMGGAANVESAEFRFDALAPEAVEGWIQDPTTGRPRKVRVDRSDWPSLSGRSALRAQGADVRTVLLRGTDGLTYSQAKAKAQGMVDASTERVAIGEGVLDSTRDRRVLRARGLVAVRGAGASFDGDYYVQRVTHEIRRGSYKQRFTVVRDGSYPRLPVVPV